VLPFPNPTGKLTGVDYINLHKHPAWLDEAHTAMEEEQERSRSNTEVVLPPKTHGQYNSCDISLYGNWEEAKRDFDWDSYSSSACLMNKLEVLYGLGHGFLFAEVGRSGPIQPIAYLHPVSAEGRHQARLFVPTRQANYAAKAAAEEEAGTDPSWDCQVYSINCPNAKNSLGNGASPALAPVRIAGGTWHQLLGERAARVGEELQKAIPEVSADFYTSGSCMELRLPPVTSLDRLTRYDRYKNTDLSLHYSRTEMEVVLWRQLDGDMSKRFPKVAVTPGGSQHQDELHLHIDDQVDTPLLVDDAASHRQGAASQGSGRVGPQTPVKKGKWCANCVLL